MGHPFQHPKGQELLKRVAQSFRAQDTYILQSSNIIFVCGGPMGSCKMRPRFCEYAKREISHLRIFLAENAQKDYVQHDEAEFHNVAKFEDIIAEISACIILFPESPGSFAELGYFARSEKLRRKLLVINNADLQGQDSFIALGPINLIDRYSKFGPAIQLYYSNSPNFTLIRDRLDRRIAHSNRKRFKAQEYSELSVQKKFYFIFEIIRLFHALTDEEIQYTFRSIWRNANRTELHQLLSILVASNYVTRHGEEQIYFCINREEKPFLEFESLNVQTFKMQVIDFYEKNFPEIAEIVRGLSQ